MTPLLSGDNILLLWAVLLLCIALGFWAERIWIGARFSGAVVTLLLAFLLSNTGIIPAASVMYQNIWTYMVPLAIPLLLLHVNISRIFRESAAVFAAFCLGVIGTTAGTLLAYYLVPLGDNAGQLAASVSAGFIGGPYSYSTTATAVGLTDDRLLAAGMAATNLTLFICLLVLFMLPTFSRFRRNFREPVRDDRFTRTTAEVSSEARKGARIHIPSLSFTLALSAGLCAASFWLENRLAWPGSGIPILAAGSVIVALVFRKPLSVMQGPHETGLFFMHLLLTVVGASAHLATALQLDPMVLLFAVVVIVVHLLVILVTGYFARLSLPELMIASNAGIGNVYTAVAMAAVKRWDHLIVAAIISASVGALVGSVAGVSLYGLFWK